MILLTDDNFDKEVNIDGLVFVYFSATWCGPCKVYAPIFEKLSIDNVNVKMCKADVDTCSQKASNFSITAVPTTVLFKNGQKVHVLTGVKQEEDLIEAINLHTK